MNARFLRRSLLSSVAVLLLAACGGEYKPQPAFVPGGSTSALEHNSPALLYVTNTAGKPSVSYYAYRNGKPKLEGKLTGFRFPAQPCTDAAGNVFIPDEFNATVTEYAHGGTTPLQTLSGNGLIGPTGCSVDPTTGNLAVADINGNYVLVYAGGTGVPAIYRDSGGSLMQAEYCGFDGKGNLFVTGKSSAGQGSGPSFTLAELPKGANDLTDLTVTGHTFQFPSNVQWTGSELLVGDQGNGPSMHASVNVVAVSGVKATVTATYSLPTSANVTGFWKVGRGANASIAVAALDEDAVPIYAFPGLSVLTTLTRGVKYPFGVVVSP